MNALLLLLLFSIGGFGVGEGKDLYSIKDEKTISWKLPKEPKEISKSSVIKKPRQRGNLPPILIRKSRVAKSIRTPEKAIIFPKLAGINKSGIDIGDVFDCIIEQDIKAYVDSKSPIRARITSGEHEGSIFIGNAVMDPKTKNVLIWFDHLRNLDTGVKHKLLASIHSVTGEVGLVGTHHSRYWSHFFAMLLSRGAEGYAQASVERNQNIFGNYQQIPNQNNAGKVAVAEAASGTADLVAEKMRNLPEYVTKRGPIKTKVFITKTPSLVN